MVTWYPLVMGREVMLATEHYLATAAGLKIFARGGNAIDAAVAADLVESVVNPHMHTLGGEAPALVYSAKAGRVVAVNGNTAAPARATIARLRSMGLDLIPGEGLLAAGVPAALDALVHMLAHFGTRTLGEVAEPALALCEEGFPAHAGLTGIEGTGEAGPGGGGDSLLRHAEKFRKSWPTSAELYLPGGEAPKACALLRNPAKAAVLRRLLEAEATARGRGREAALMAARDRFYRGDIAREIAAWSEKHDGLLSLEDLERFETRLEEPVSADYRGLAVFKCGPWSQGPVFLQQLRLVEGFDLRTMGHNSTDYIHHVVEAAKLCFADREAYYADPIFVDVPIAALLSREYAQLRRPLIDPARASMELRPGDPRRMRALGEMPGRARPWGGGTVGVVAGDRLGNLVAITGSGGWIASSPVVETLGFPLGTRLQTFHLDEGHPNALAPGKRPRTTLSPSLVLRDGRPYLAFGTPGGDAQDQWTLQFFLNVVDFGMDLQEAIEAPKFSIAHFPSSFYPRDAHPGLVRVEERVAEPTRAALAARGHRVETRPAWCEGRVIAVAIDRERGLLLGGADPRGQLSTLLAAQAAGW